MTLKILPYGPGAILVEILPDHAADLAQQAATWEGVTDAVVGAQTVLLTYEGLGRSEAEARAEYTELVNNYTATTSAEGPPTRSLTIPVHYDGDDLQHVAAVLGVDTDAVVDLHASVEYHVGFMGFAPGFGYLQGLPENLHLPRRATPRPRVPAGSVAIAGSYSAVYPGASPGGWLLLGRTTLRLFDPTNANPSLLEPGMRIRFEPR